MYIRPSHRSAALTFLTLSLTLSLTDGRTDRQNWCSIYSPRMNASCRRLSNITHMIHRLCRPAEKRPPSVTLTILSDIRVEPIRFRPLRILSFYINKKLSGRRESARRSILCINVKTHIAKIAQGLCQAKRA